MEPFAPAQRRGGRLALGAVGLLVLLAVVAFASRSGFGHHAHAAPSSGYVSYAFTAFLILFALAIPVAAYAFLLQAREGDPERKGFLSRTVANLVILFVFLGIALGIAYLKRHHLHLFSVHGASLHRPRVHRPGHGAPAGFEPTFKWPVLWVALVLVGGFGAWVFGERRARKRRAGRSLPAAAVAEELAATISDAIDDLEAEPDARRAVIAAYARMESVLARHGLERRASETPLEYLRRILGDLTSRADAVSQLTTLFEQAKFSRHTIDTTMKLEAIGALRAIRDDLQAVPAA